jgi:hypothetical protein
MLTKTAPSACLVLATLLLALPLVMPRSIAAAMSRSVGFTDLATQTDDQQPAGTITTVAGSGPTGIDGGFSCGGGRRRRVRANTPWKEGHAGCGKMRRAGVRNACWAK